MSKEAALRAMREARYLERTAGAATAPRPRSAVRAAKPSAPQAETPATAPPASSADELCGHRSMNGRTCTREHGHAAKSHRYG